LLWKNRDFVRLWSASTTSVFGTMMSAMAIPWIAIDVIGASDVAVALLATLRMLPGFLFGIAAGTWVDRLRRRPLLIGSDLGRALVFACVPLAFVLDSLTMVLLAVVVLVAESLSVLFDVAAHSYLPSLVARDELVEGNAKLTGGAAVAEAFGFGISGWLARLITAPFVLAVDAATYVASALMIRGIQAPEALEPAQERDAWREIREGFSELRRVPGLAALAWAETLRGMAWGIFGTGYMLWMMRGLDFSLPAIGMIAFTGSLGSFAGSLIARRLDTRFGTGPTMVTSLALAAFSYLLIPLAPDAAWLGITFLVMHQILGDTFDTTWSIVAVSTRQRLSDPARLGRVNGAIRFGFSAATLAAALVCTAAIQFTGPRLLLFAAVAVGGAAALFVARSPLLRDASGAHAA
jgi:MFS family permease